MSKDIAPQTDPIWVHREHFSSITGITKDTIRGWQDRQLLTRDVHYKVIGRNTLINQEEFNSWLSKYGQNISGQQTKPASVFASEVKTKSTIKQSQANMTRKLISKRQLQKGTA